MDQGRNAGHVVVVAASLGEPVRFNEMVTPTLHASYAVGCFVSGDPSWKA